MAGEYKTARQAWRDAYLRLSTATDEMTIAYRRGDEAEVERWAAHVENAAVEVSQAAQWMCTALRSMPDTERYAHGVK